MQWLFSAIKKAGEAFTNRQAHTATTKTGKVFVVKQHAMKYRPAAQQLSLFDAMGGDEGEGERTSLFDAFDDNDEIDVDDVIQEVRDATEPDTTEPEPAITGPGEIRPDREQSADRSDVGRYQADGIIVGREAETQYPEKDYLSELVPRLLKDLRDHQRDCVNLAMQAYANGSKSFVCADGTGAGKTREELAMAATRAALGERVVIFTENDRIIDTSFQKDAAALGIEVVKLKGVRNISQDMIKPGKIYITTYSSADKLAHVGSLYDRKTGKTRPEQTGIDFDFVVCDECHNLKNESLKNQHTMDVVSRAARSFMASATPMDKGDHVRYLADAFGFNFDDLMRNFGYSYNSRFDYWKREVDVEESAMRISCFFDQLTLSGQMVKREVSLKNLDFKTDTIQLGDVYHSKVKDLIDDLDMKLERASDMARGRVKATGLMRIRRFLEEAKLEATKNHIKNELKAGRKVVLFATRVNESSVFGKYGAEQETEQRWAKYSGGSGRSALDDLERFEETTPGTLNELSKWLTEEKIQYTALYGGNKTADETRAAMREFNDGDSQVFITTPGSGGTGLNLDDTTGAAPRTCIIMTPPFSANDVIQMVGRVCRLTTKSRSKAILISSDNAIDNWNGGIIETKLATLAAAVQGDYAKISVEDMKKMELMTDAEIQEYQRQKNINIQVAVKERRSLPALDDVPGASNFQYNDFSEWNRGNEFKSFAFDAIVDDSQKDEAQWGLKPEHLRFDVQWPNPTIKFGKHAGKKVSELPQQYATWLLGETLGIDNKWLNERYGRIKWHQGVQKALNWMRDALRKSHIDPYMRASKSGNVNQVQGYDRADPLFDTSKHNMPTVKPTVMVLKKPDKKNLSYRVHIDHPGIDKADHRTVDQALTHVMSYDLPDDTIATIEERDASGGISNLRMKLKDWKDLHLEKHGLFSDGKPGNFDQWREEKHHLHRPPTSEKKSKKSDDNGVLEGQLALF